VEIRQNAGDEGSEFRRLVVKLKREKTTGGQ